MKINMSWIGRKYFSIFCNIGLVDIQMILLSSSPYVSDFLPLRFQQVNYCLLLLSYIFFCAKFTSAFLSIGNAVTKHLGDMD